MVKDFFTRICHADMKYVSPGFDHLVTAVPKPDELAIAYQQMLINGPFRAFSDLIGLHCIGDNYYLLCSNLGKWPANVLYNFCIASRVPIERPQFLPYWKELVDQGFEKTLAFLLSYSTNGKPWSKGNGREYPVCNHLWLDTASDWKNILSGEMIRMNPPFKEYPKGCEPCNVIWSTSTDYRKIWNMSNEEVSEFFNLPIEIPAPPPAPKPKLKKKGLQEFVYVAPAIAGNNPAQLVNPNPWQQFNINAQQAIIDIEAQQAQILQMAHENGFGVAAGGAMAEQPAPPPQPAHIIIDDEPLDDEDDPVWGEDPDVDFDEDDDDFDDF